MSTRTRTRTLLALVLVVAATVTVTGCPQHPDPNRQPAQVWELNAIPFSDCEALLHSVSAKNTAVYLNGKRVTRQATSGQCGGDANEMVVISPVSACTKTWLAECTDLPGKQ